MARVDQIRVIDFTDGEPKIGMGFNSDTLEFPGTALTFTQPGPDPSGSGQVVAGHAKIINSHEELQEAIGTSISVSGRYGLSSASAKVDYSKNTGYNTTSTFVLAQASVVNPIVRGENFVLTSTADTVLNQQHNLDGFRTAFGDSFVRGIKSGGEFFAVFRLTALRQTTQEKLAATLTADINFGLAGGNFNGQFNTASTDENDRAEVEISFYQAAGSGPTASIVLSPDEILQRLHNFPTFARDNPMPYKVEIATYDTIPISITPPEEKDNFILSLEHDDAKKLEYIKAKNDVDFALQHPEFFDDLPSTEVLQSESEIYLQLINAVMDHAVRLARGKIPTPEMFDPGKVGLTEPVPRQFKRKVATLLAGTWQLTRTRMQFTNPTAVGELEDPDPPQSTWIFALREGNQYDYQVSPVEHISIFPPFGGGIAAVLDGLKVSIETKVQNQFTSQHAFEVNQEFTSGAGTLTAVFHGASSPHAISQTRWTKLH